MIEYKDQQVKPSNYAIIRWFGFDKFVPEQAVTSYWVSPKALFIIRLLLALYTTIVFWTFLALTAVFSDLRRFFSAFTTMTFIGLHGYLITASVHLFRYLRHKNVDFLLNQAPVWNYLYMYLYSTIITFNILTPAVFWSILNTEAFWVRFTTEVGQVPPIIIMWINVSVHGDENTY
ncbi:hypothetical protein [Parasitella parasitica]|uniref:Uncharacterized protein n=1 Tax=Parasitella parasitica TaxID=35722 RepID=A0A0B7NQC4_9FUNG|nr:hypothetical protein [Parasitella parasitica]